MIKVTKAQINRNIVPHLSKGKRGPKCKVELWRVVRAILYRMKTGIQWRELPIKSLFGRHAISWKSVYYYFSKWSGDGSMYLLWANLLRIYRSILDMSSVQLDGSQTIAKRGGESVGYQNRKKAKSTNQLFLTDRQGIPLACSDPVSGNHNDLFEIKECMSKIIGTLSAAGIDHKGLFMNGDAGFDAQELRSWCYKHEIIPNLDLNKRNSKDPDEHDYYFDNQLYKERFAVERTNAWLDGFKGLLVRYEVKARNWLSLHYLAFSVILLRKAGFKL